MELFSDEVLSIVVPIVVYWAYSGMYVALGSSVEKYRLHSRAEEAKNLVSKRDVVMVVLCQQLVQATLSTLMMIYTAPGETELAAAAEAAATATSQSSVLFQLLTLARQFFVAMLVMDTWQYVWHRYMHINRFLYRHIHSWHHRLLVPYPYGTFYSHPIDGFLLDTIGGLLSFVVSGMSPRASIFFFSFGIMKAVDDHCGVMRPWNVFHRFFWNNTAYHDVHHQMRGHRFNYSQPFFVSWDKVFGTYMPYVVEKRSDGGLEARPLLEKATNGKQN